MSIAKSLVCPCPKDALPHYCALFRVRGCVFTKVTRAERGRGAATGLSPDGAALPDLRLHPSTRRAPAATRSSPTATPLPRLCSWPREQPPARQEGTGGHSEPAGLREVVADPVLRPEHRKPRPRGTGLRQVSKQKLKKPEETGGTSAGAAPHLAAPRKARRRQTATRGWPAFQALLWH